MSLTSRIVYESDVARVRNVVAATALETEETTLQSEFFLRRVADTRTSARTP